jgi:hypothetical protein
MRVVVVLIVPPSIGNVLRTHPAEALNIDSLAN